MRRYAHDHQDGDQASVEHKNDGQALGTGQITG
jgi:hypothetical protein